MRFTSWMARGMSAKLEEVVVNTYAREPKHLGEDLAEDLLLWGSGSPVAFDGPLRGGKGMTVHLAVWG